MNNKVKILRNTSRRDKDKLPKVIFFFRHINDLDFSLPLALFATNPKIIIYQKLDLTDRRIKLLNERNVTIEYLNNPILDMVEIFSDFFTALLFKISLKKASKIFKFKIELIVCFFLKKAMVHLITQKNFFEDVKIFAFDHTSCNKSKSLIDIIRNKSSKNSKINIISLPHGADIFQNRMIDYWQLDIEPNKQDYNHFDHVICNDQQHFNSLDGKKTIIDSLRYTKEWQEFMGFHHIKKLKELKNNAGVKLLFLLSKFEGGINVAEVQRALNILQRFPNIKLKIKPHPRGLRQLNKINIYNSEVVSGDVQEHIAEADCIINIQSNAVFDAYLQEKLVIFPAYMTSNDWLKDIKEHALVANTPDDFLRYIRDLSIGKSVEIKNYDFNQWDVNMVKWTNFFSSLG
jgi:hypothetical protein